VKRKNKGKKKKKKKLNQKTRRAVAAMLPNLLTLGNAVCGFGAIVFIAGAASGWEPDQGLRAAFDDMKLQIACWLVFAALVFDALDGSVARMTRQTSNLGAQLDSLSDAVSFALAPAFLVWKIIALLPRDVIHIPQKVAWVLALLYLVCGLLRLARFNIETGPEMARTKSFKGLPTPAAAMVIVSLTLLAVDILMDGGERFAWVTNAFFLAIPVIAFFMGILMVSRVPYPHLVERLFRGKRSFHYLVQSVFVLAVLAVLPYLSLSVALISSIYVIAGLVLFVRERIPAKAPAGAEEAPPAPAADAQEAKE